MRLINVNNLLNGKTQPKQKKKALNFENTKRLLKGRQKVYNGFGSKIFPIGEQTQGIERPLDLAMRITTLSPKQMLQGSPIALAQIKAGNTSENLLNKIQQIIHSFCQRKEITKKVYNNIINSIKI